MRLRAVACAAANVAVCASVLVSGQVAAKLDYDTYCKLPTIEAKQQAMAAVSNENGFEILHTHYQRFLDANRARLSAEQTALLQEMIAALASLSAPKQAQKPPDFMALGKLVEKQRTVFSAEDNQRLKPTTGCIPKS
jgi:hypothetical protein